VDKFRDTRMILDVVTLRWFSSAHFFFIWHLLHDNTSRYVWTIPRAISGCTWGKFRTSTGQWFYGRRTVRYPSRLWLDLSRR